VSFYKDNEGIDAHRGRWKRQVRPKYVDLKMLLNTINGTT